MSNLPANVDPNMPGAITAVNSALLGIRPYWMAKPLVQRVRVLLPVDPSSACQRLLNAAFHDLREKIRIAGLDIANEVAKQNRLPQMSNEQAIDEYDNRHTLDLAYRMGILDPSDYRRMVIAYQIRRNLEHEDDDFEAGAQDLIYIFKTCIDAVLSKDPIELLRVSDVRLLIESADPVSPSEALRVEFEDSPSVRKLQVLKLLVSYAVDENRPDIVRRNAFESIRIFNAYADNPMRIELAKQITEAIDKMPPSYIHYRVAHACDALGYFAKKYRTTCFCDGIATQLEGAGHQWRRYAEHTPILSILEECGGLQYCPRSCHHRILKWLVLCWLGERGGYGDYGRTRPVFYSDSGCQIIRRLFLCLDENSVSALKALSSDPEIVDEISDKRIARRWEQILDIVDNLD